MLKTFTINNFKKFEKTTLSNFNRINIFVGNNNSGKSTVLEAIYLASSTDLSGTYYQAQRNLFNFPITYPQDAMTRVDEMKKILFYNFDNPIIFNLDVAKHSTDNIKHAVISMSVQNTSAAEIETYLQKSNKDNSTSSEFIKYSLCYQQEFDNITFSSSLLFVANTTQFISNGKLIRYIYKAIYFRHDVNAMIITYREIVKSDQKDNLIQILQQFDSSFGKIELLDNAFWILMQGQKDMLPINYIGSGFAYILSIILHLLFCSNCILLIDEIENGIYYKKFDILIKVINELSIKNNIQVMITTHSEDFITRIGQFNDITLFRLNDQFDNGVIIFDNEKIKKISARLSNYEIDVR